VFQEKNSAHYAMLADCKFAHPPSRPTPRGAKFPYKPAPTNGSMNKSKKFGVAAAKPDVSTIKTEGKLNPSAGEFKPEKELEVTS
jgi:hypothetical protein